jgi:hypothetical protein
MPEDFDQVILPVLVCLFVIWLLYRINNRIAKKAVGNRISKDFPYLKSSAENFQHKVDYLASRLEVIEQKINELERKFKAQEK